MLESGLLYSKKNNIKNIKTVVVKSMSDVLLLLYRACLTIVV